MNTTQLLTKFAALGARAKVRPLVRPLVHPASRPVLGAVRIDIGHDRRGEFFDIQVARDAQLEVLDLQPRDRHLLLLVRQPPDRPGLPDRKDKFLCGHDERHWFVAGVPEAAGVSSVVTAKEALKPELVRELERGQRGPLKRRQRRRTTTFVRQGEWFFVPVSGVKVVEKWVLRNEPIRRGAGKPHYCEFLYRQGGTTVYVCGRHPNGLTTDEYKELLRREPEALRWKWQVMRRNPLVLVRGRVSHPDHATIELDGWHRVEMNTEHLSRAQAAVAFLD